MAENTLKNDTILVCFEDPTIQSLFTDLLHNHGARVQEADSLDGLSEMDARAITEVRQLLSLPRAEQARCVVVADAEAELFESPALILRRPLTEQKIILALEHLLTDPV